MDEVTHTILPNTAGGGWGGTALGAGFGGLIGSWLGNGGFGGFGGNRAGIGYDTGALNGIQGQLNNVSGQIANNRIRISLILVRSPCILNCQRYEKIKKNPQQKLRVKTIKDCMCFVTFTKVDLNSYGSSYFNKYLSIKSKYSECSKNNLTSISNFVEIANLPHSMA